jgi:hypothetical protein
MELDLDGPLAERVYPILASLVTPRPIALVTISPPWLCEKIHEILAGLF